MEKIIENIEITTLILTIEYLYQSILKDELKRGFALDEIKNHDICNNKSRLDEIIDNFELDFTPPTCSVVLSEKAKIARDLIIKARKTENYTEITALMKNISQRFLEQ